MTGEGNGSPLQYPCLENPMDGGAWQASVHRLQELDTTVWLTHTHIKSNMDFLGDSGVKNLPEMQEMWVQSLGWEDSPGGGVATYSSILAGKIPRTEEHCGLQSMGLQRVGHD